MQNVLGLLMFPRTGKRLARLAFGVGRQAARRPPLHICDDFACDDAIKLEDSFTAARYFCTRALDRAV